MRSAIGSCRMASSASFTPTTSRSASRYSAVACWPPCCSVPGVASAITTGDNFVFQRLNQVPDPQDLTQGFLRMDRLEIARLDNDPSQPENGTLQLVMQGGT